jgi:hypothetical protein
MALTFPPLPFPQTGSEAPHLVSYPVGTRGLFPLGYIGRSVNLIVHILLMSRLKALHLIH